MRALESSWKSVFKQDIKSKVFHANEEFVRYKKTQQIIYLQQACSKLFSAVENFFMIKYDTRVRSFQDLLVIVNSNKSDSILLTQAAQLHYFFYNSELQMSKEEVVILYNDVKNKLMNRLKRKEILKK